MSTAISHCTPEVSKRIAYNRTTHDYDCFLQLAGASEQYIGSAPTYDAAETTCGNAAHALLAPPPLPYEDVPDQPIGTFCDGTPIYGMFERTTPSGLVRAVLGDWYLLAGHNGYTCLSHQELKISVDDLTLHSIAVLRTLLNSGALEHLIAVAEAWQRGEAAPLEAAPMMRAA